MNETLLTPEDLLAGACATFEIAIPPEILQPRKGGQSAGQRQDQRLILRPLSIGVFQLILKAARQDAGLIPLLMIKESLVKPAMTLEQIKQLHLGLIEFLVGHIREISGLAEKKNGTA